jgi:hypothetical protein
MFRHTSLLKEKSGAGRNEQHYEAIVNVYSENAI